MFRYSKNNYKTYSKKKKKKKKIIIIIILLLLQLQQQRDNLNHNYDIGFNKNNKVLSNKIKITIKSEMYLSI